MEAQPCAELKKNFTRPRNIPIEGVLWLFLSLLCWCNDWYSLVSIVTALNLLVHVCLDVIRYKTLTQDQRDGDPPLWRNSTTTSSNTKFDCCDNQGKYLSITLIPILMESMYILSKRQNQETRSSHNTAPANDYHPVSSYWHNVALIVSTLQIITWTMDLYRVSHQNYWKQQSVILYRIAILLSLLLLVLSCLKTFQTLDDELWFCFFWVNILWWFGPIYHLSLQGIMTYGEWSAISCCFALVGTSIWTAALQEMKYFITNRYADNIIRNTTADPISVERTDVSTFVYAYTATAGVLGCIVACSTVNHLLQYKNTNQIVQQKYPNITRFCHPSIITNALRIIYISVVTLGIVESMFWYFQLTPRHTFPKCLSLWT